MGRWTLRAAAAVGVALACQGGEACAQYGYPVGYGGYGWNGWGGGGGGGQTVQGNMARGLGAYAAGAGYYNEQTAVARSINADTVTKFNEYMWESQVLANRRERERMAQRGRKTNETQAALEKRLRDDPTPADIYRGDALNVAVEQINDPRVYTKALSAAKAKIGGEAIRDIPFQHASDAITTSIHQITQGPLPAALKAPAYEADRAAMKAVGAKIRGQIEKDGKPDPATIDEAITVVDGLESKVDADLPRNTRPRNDADKYLKALHGLLGMLKTPAMDFLLSGVEKRPDATLGDLLTFMASCNLRFGPAVTPRQKLVYDQIYPELDALRDQVAKVDVDGKAIKGDNHAAAGEFFSGMPYEDLRKRAPAPPPPNAPK